MSYEFNLLRALCLICREILRKREDGRAPDWHLYFLCGLLGAIETFSLENTCESLEICVDGRVPPRAGLSSSSALVCASTLATLLGNKVSAVLTLHLFPSPVPPKFREVRASLTLPPPT